ncbi:pheromone shutdown-related protein TraB [Salsuginibacillus halophilus]|uniref:Pheromone shutdown-related protein TraB n=1 Tax=Salsuginibacillus halophilus TaxID=517424 RepID=A0A2P8H9Q9_9BACI|nr:TraB/GumN family protein [Salsuginibacillus halophilus]PSL42920.1 pheromone shutdown-related protein TraB [Salsuginibacillus halophilus]
MSEQSQNVTRLYVEGKEVVLIGTAHVSKRSTEEVKEVIEQEKPDSVAVELDAQRYQSLVNRDQWKDMDIFKVIKERKATLLLMNLAISSFQKRTAKQFGINAGEEMMQGVNSAEECEAELVLADRNIQTTFSRIWHKLGFFGKLKLLMSIVMSIFNKENISEEEMERMKSQDMLQSMLDEMAQHFPGLKIPLIDERDRYLSEHIRTAPGEKVVAVVGAAHVPGILNEIENKQDLDALNEVKKSKVPKILAWAIPIFILSIIGYTFLNNPSVGMQQMLTWLLWNGSFSALGTAIAFGHPLAILTAFVAAPLTSLNPFVAAGWFAGFVQAYFRRPSVEDFEALSDDVTSAKGFWHNKVTRILLIVVFANLGSTLGTVIGGADVVRLFIENVF